MRLARGSRDAGGVWHADDPDDYPPMDVHGVLPWSVLRQDGRMWQERKKWWKESYGLGAPIGRESASGMMRSGRHGELTGGVSVFDPFLAELLLTWYCPPGSLVLDPFGGGPERAVVASELGHRYIGIDPAGRPTDHTPGSWITGYSQEELMGIDSGIADMVLACPPYHNRERYSDDPRDLSAMSWSDYLDTLDQIVAQTVRCLHGDRFAAWVISDVRDHRGHLRRLPQLLSEMLISHGMHLTGEYVLVSPIGTAHKRMRRPWESCRTPTRLHQVVYIAVKGDRRAATKAVRGC